MEKKKHKIYAHDWTMDIWGNIWTNIISYHSSRSKISWQLSMTIQWSLDHSTSAPPEKMLPCSVFPRNFLPVGSWCHGVWRTSNGKKSEIWDGDWWSHLLHGQIISLPKSQGLKLKKWSLVLCSICYPQVFTHGTAVIDYRWLLISICQTCVFLDCQVWLREGIFSCLLKKGAKLFQEILSISFSWD